jgi:hypothetical protein
VNEIGEFLHLDDVDLADFRADAIEELAGVESGTEHGSGS